MRYFADLPKINYDIEANGSLKLVPDIFRRVKIRSKIKEIGRASCRERV